MKTPFLFVSILILLGQSCQSPASKTLPILGERMLEERTVDGKIVVDTIFHQIDSFSYLDQDSTLVTEASVKGKIYVADFFFSSCPSLCPRVKAEMKKVYNKYKSEPRFQMISYTIDPQRDNVKRLSWYARKLNIQSKTWHLLTGSYGKLTKTAANYLLSAQEDPSAPGGFDHSGYVVLVDQNRHIRGMYDGTDPEKMKMLISDIQILLDAL
jgi:protein SCO1/2